jgi:nucleotide-binding universal stress UspA family protein
MSEREQAASFGRVIVGVDGRQGGRDAIELARQLLAPNGALALAHVRSDGLVPPGAWAEAAESTGIAAAGTAAGATSANGAPEALAADRSQELLACERADAKLEARVIDFVASSVGSGLHHLAEREGADLLVVGSCHRGFLGRVFVGNDTRASLNGAPCAVAVAPLAYAREPARVRTIGVGYDRSEESEAALGLARELADRSGAGVRALQITQVPGPFYTGFGGVAWGDTLDTVLAEAKQRMAQLDGVEGEAQLGLAGEQLAAFGDHVDLLVVGSRAYGPLRRLMLGSTSRYLAGHARCPLLVLPRGTRGRSSRAPAGEHAAAAPRGR